MITSLLWLIPVLPLLGFVINGLGRNTLSKGAVGFIGSGVVLASFILSVCFFFELNSSVEKQFTVNFFDWIS
ncbi:hypothetical protein RCK87_27025, partial [Salmonella enterica subsp. enterica serovar 1,4,[5],12:i:-]